MIESKKIYVYCGKVYEEEPIESEKIGVRPTFRIEIIK